jgi:hypothetical protein
LTCTASWSMPRTARPISTCWRRRTRHPGRCCPGLRLGRRPQGTPAMISKLDIKIRYRVPSPDAGVPPRSGAAAHPPSHRSR